jgi:heme o synthase
MPVVTDAHPLMQKSDSLTFMDLFRLTKPTVALLVVVTALPAMLTSGGASLPSASQLVAVVCGILATSVASSIFNQILDIDIDIKMKRTEGRLIATQKISIRQGLMVGLFFLVTGFLALYKLATPLAAYVALGGVAFYVFIYTMYLKRRTVQNIVIGGAAGAVGPLIGSAAVFGEITFSAWLMFLIIFLWTPAHFWALALELKDDYAKAGVPMLPVIKGDAVTRRAILLYAVSLLPVTIYLCLLMNLGNVSNVIINGLTLWFIVEATRLWLSGNNDRAMATFRFSCLYLLIVYGAMTIDVLVRTI